MLMKSRAIPYGMLALNVTRHCGPLIYSFADTASFEALIMAYGKTGRINEAFDIFSQMKQANPTGVSVRAYTGLLVACRECREVSRIKDVKEDMELNKIIPDDVFLRTLGSIQKPVQ